MEKQMSFQFSQRSKDRMEGVDPRLIEIANLALRISPIDFGIPKTGGVRTTEMQQTLFKDGVSKADGVRHVSEHQIRPGEKYGRALDFYSYVKGAPSWDKHNMAIVGAAFLQAASALGYRLQWGGLWKNFKDYPHVQIVE
jgi:peptidoglycan L-alanyl-D-glutamate endopeptidase CwlK